MSLALSSCSRSSWWATSKLDRRAITLAEVLIWWTRPETFGSHPTTRIDIRHLEHTWCSTRRETRCISLTHLLVRRKTGKFTDGTVLVKEVFGTMHAQMTTGDAHWASGTKVWFVMIKDEKGRYSSNPLWGDGWGWALYNSDAPDKQVATDYKKDCLGCHIPARGTDWVY